MSKQGPKRRSGTRYGAKLTPLQVQIMRARWSQSGLSIRQFVFGEQARLAREGVTVSVSTLRDVLARSSFSNLP